MTLTATAETVLKAAVEEPLRDVWLQGASGTGKTTLALAIEEAASEQGMTPVLVRPPAGAPESGPIAVGGAIAVLDDGDFAARPRRYLEGLTKLRFELHQNKDRVVVIADEPSAWSRGDAYFSGLAREATGVLLRDHAWPTIVLDQASQPAPLRRLETNPLEIDFSDWGELRDAAEQLSGRLPHQRPRNPLELAISSALLAWGHAVPEIPTSASRLAEILVEVLAARRAGPRLWAVWQRVALARTELPDSVLDELGRERLDALSRDTLRHALLDGGGRLHEAARVTVGSENALGTLSSTERTTAHRRLFEYHREQSATAADAAAATRHGGEALFHLGEIGDEALVDTVPPLFVDQLNALGRTLSLKHGDHFSAAAVFARAIDLDQENGYAQHFRGFNLDFQGERRDEVAERYETAIAIDPSNPWWHARQVTFLADTGKLRAAHTAWDRAQSQAAAIDTAGFAGLHARVAGALLHQGELSFAEEVLSAVPQWVATEETRQLRLALDARFQAQDTGAVVPAPRSSERWWEKPPRALAQIDTDGRHLAGWIAGRVEMVDGEGLHLRVAIVDSDTGAPPRLGHTVIDRERWSASCLDGAAVESLAPGQFVEIGTYTDEENGERLAIRLVTPDPYRQPAPPLMPLDRWLRRDATAFARPA